MSQRRASQYSNGRFYVNFRLCKLFLDTERYISGNRPEARKLKCQCGREGGMNVKCGRGRARGVTKAWYAPCLVEREGGPPQVGGGGSATSPHYL